MIGKVELNYSIFMMMSFSWILGHPLVAQVDIPKPVIVGADQWCPFFCEKGKNFDGYSVELINEALKRNGIQSEYQVASFPRVTAMIEAGVWHIHGATDKSFTPNLIMGRESVAFSRWVYVSRKSDKRQYDHLFSNKNAIFGVAGGYVYSPKVMDYIEKHAKSNKIISVTHTKPQNSLLNLLKVKRIDYFIEDESVIAYWADKLGLSSEIKFTGLDNQSEYYPGYKKNDPVEKKLSKILDRSLGELKKDERFMDALRAKYFLRFKSTHLKPHRKN